ncbi:MAG: hypothetical protein NC411_05355 [Bacteroides sp.]|nr:hypothetical protein [Bacteroides sp.]
MKRLLTFIASAAIFSTFSLSAKVIRNYVSTSDDILTFVVDSIDYRQDLTRVYGKLKGRPHTSNRVDEVQYIGSGTGSVAVSKDIDGVDFRRYFQWEDDGLIPVEIDFPAMKPDAGVQLLFKTAYGQSTTTVKKTAPKHRQ